MTAPTSGHAHASAPGSEGKLERLRGFLEALDGHKIGPNGLHRVVFLSQKELGVPLGFGFTLCYGVVYSPELDEVLFRLLQRSEVRFEPSDSSCIPTLRFTAPVGLTSLPSDRRPDLYRVAELPPAELEQKAMAAYLR